MSLLTCWIVLQVESVEAVESVVRMHVQSVDGQVVRCTLWYGAVRYCACGTVMKWYESSIRKVKET